MKWDWKYLSTFEPAVLRGVWVAIVGVLTAFGLQVSDTTHAKATALIAAAAVIFPLVQAFWTRAAVTPVARAGATNGTTTAVAGGGSYTMTFLTGPSGPSDTPEPASEAPPDPTAMLRKEDQG